MGIIEKLAFPENRPQQASERRRNKLFAKMGIAPDTLWSRGSAMTDF
jgi:hypothetical protein